MATRPFGDEVRLFDTHGTALGGPSGADVAAVAAAKAAKAGEAGGGEAGGGVLTLQSLSFEVAPGELLGIAGAVSGGRSCPGECRRPVWPP